MAQPIIMPRLTIDMEKGTVLEWKKEEGEQVEQGEIVAVVFGDKVEWEVEAPASGFLIRIAAQPDAEVAVSAPIGWVGEPGETPGEDPPAAPAGHPAKPQPAQAGEAAPAAAEFPGRQKASPAAKRLAKELGVDLQAVRGTGPGGRIVEADVQEAFKSAAKPAQPAGAVALSPLRKTIAERMLRSWRNAPHFTLEIQADMSSVFSQRRKTKAEGRPAPTVNDILVLCAAKALAECEFMRRRWSGEELRRLEGSSIGVAVHTEEGLTVPVIPAAGGMGIGDLSAAIRSASERARSGKLKPSDLEPASMTVTNLGMLGVRRFAPVINHPECSILAAGEAVFTPVAVEGGFVSKPVMTLCLAVDHCAIDGALAAGYLKRLKELLEGAGGLF